MSVSTNTVVRNAAEVSMTRTKVCRKVLTASIDFTCKDEEFYDAEKNAERMLLMHMYDGVFQKLLKVKYHIYAHQSKAAIDEIDGLLKELLE